MAFNQLKHALGIFPSRQSALRALNELRDADFPMHKITAIAKESEHDEQRERYRHNK
ncbi:MAG: hypothetical protein HC862_07065 [Scytonema sp. RU_4_4]|nr:hypothetical protein [Scytonema sp. RU_4_4]NJR73495.1 hypothetical protein [Scytonema sp. CRU_2_7]